MGGFLFTNVRIIDGSGEQPFTGDVLVEGNRIKSVTRGARGMPSGSYPVIDGAGCTLMPGMTEAHTHLSWNDQPSLEAISLMPPEEHTLFAAAMAKRYIEMGWTSCVGAAAAKPRLDVVIRNAINSGQIPGPRYSAASQEITTLGGLGDTTPPHINASELSFGCVVSGPEEMRRAVRTFIKYGCDSIKLNLSGEEIAGVPAKVTQMTDEEVAVACAEAKLRGLRVAAHARSNESIRQCVRHGIEIIYHASYADEQTLDYLEEHKDKHFVAPALAWLIKTSTEAEAYGIKPDSWLAQQYAKEAETAIDCMRKMHRRGIRVLPGGDYGFAWIPHGTNAKDLEYFVERVGMSPMEAIVSATKYGGEIVGRGHELGMISEGYLADIILVDGDPLANIRILQERKRILAVMKDGVFYREPEGFSQRQAFRRAG